jgi:hypothetical protein
MFSSEPGPQANPAVRPLGHLSGLEPVTGDGWQRAFSLFVYLD